jgi:hypothetical protein
MAIWSSPVNHIFDDEPDLFNLAASTVNFQRNHRNAQLWTSSSYHEFQIVHNTEYADNLVETYIISHEEHKIAVKSHDPDCWKV